MKKLVPVIITFATLLLVSCSKEKSIDSSDTDGPQTPDVEAQDSLLVKMVSQYGNDSTTTVYEYDSQKRLKRELMTSTIPNFIEEELQISRASNGRINRMVIRSDEYLLLGVDSAVSHVFFNENINQYTHAILEYEHAGEISKDSTAFLYDNQNRITKKEMFVFDRVNNVYFPFLREEYIYQAGNLAQVKNYFFAEDQNQFVLFYEGSYEYDTQVSPLALGNEAIVIERESYYSNHNAVKQNQVYPDDPQYNFNLNIAYTYSNSKKPLLAQVEETISGGKSITKFYYQ